MHSLNQPCCDWTFQFYPFFKTLLASARKSTRLTPMRERQKTAMPTEASGNGTCTEGALDFLTIPQIALWFGTDKWRSRWPCRRPSRAHRWLPGRSCAPCSSRYERSCSRHSRSPPPREREVWKTWQKTPVGWRWSVAEILLDPMKVSYFCWM